MQQGHGPGSDHLSVTRDNEDFLEKRNIIRLMQEAAFQKEENWKKEDAPPGLQRKEEEPQGTTKIANLSAVLKKGLQLRKSLCKQHTNYKKSEHALIKNKTCQTDCISFFIK